MKEAIYSGKGEHMNTKPPPGNPKAIRNLFRVFYLGCVLLLLVELDMQVTNLVFQEHRHEYHFLEGWFAFYPIYAFGGIVLLVVVAKIMRKIFMRPENYYDL